MNNREHLEQMIKNNDIDTIMNIIDDDLWSFAYRHTGSENIVLKGSDDNE